MLKKQARVLSDKEPEMHNKLICRSWQLASAALLRVRPIEKQNILTGAGSIGRVGPEAVKSGVTKMLIVTTEGTVRRGTLKPLVESLGSVGIGHAVFEGVKPDPDIECVEDALAVYRFEECDGIIAVGGGSAMDCAKVCGARAVCPGKSVRRMAGLMKIHTRLPYFVAVPTTAGTGSEITAAAVITEKKHETLRKFTVMDFCLVPDLAVLDPLLTMGLPAGITAETGMDAFTHAIEAYLNRFSSAKINSYAMGAMKLINDNLMPLVRTLNGSDSCDMTKARENMLLASYQAGIAFTNGYVGYVHAIAHAVGALCHIPHGRACAIVLPYVLEAYGDTIAKPLDNIAAELGLDGGASVIGHIRSMNTAFGIPDRIEELHSEDIAEIAGRAVREANPGYPVPRIMSREEIAAAVRKMLL